MSVEIIVNKKTGETIKYKKKIFLDYICTEVLEEGDLDKINYIGIEKKEELISFILENKKFKVFLFSNFLLINFDDVDNHFVLEDLPIKITEDILKTKEIHLAILTNGEIEFFIDFKIIHIV
jgi:hypothetical protein